MSGRVLPAALVAAAAYAIAAGAARAPVAGGAAANRAAAKVHVYDHDGKLRFDAKTGVGTMPQARRDRVRGHAGPDVVSTGPANDAMSGRGGSDLAYLGAGTDRFVGGRGNDVAYGGADRDVLLGGRGSDVLEGEGGADVVNGGQGADVVSTALGGTALGGSGNDLVSYCWDDACAGEAAQPAQIATGEGDDVTRVRPIGPVKVQTGAGDDVVRLDVTGFPDLSAVDLELEPGPGRDTLVLPPAVSPAALPPDVADDFEEVANEDVEASAARDGKAAALREANGSQADERPAGSYTVLGPRMFDSAFPEPNEVQVAPGPNPRTIAVTLVRRYLGPVSLVLERQSATTWSWRETESRDGLLLCTRESNARSFVGDTPKAPLRSATLDLAAQSLRLECGPTTRELRFIPPSTEAAASAFLQLKGSDQDAAANPLTLSPSYPAAFPELARGSAHFSVVRPVWTLESIRRLLAAIGKSPAPNVALAGEIVDRSGLPVLPVSSIPTRESEPFRIRLLEPTGGKPVPGMRELLERSLYSRGLGPHVDAILGAVGALEVSRTAPTSRRLFQALKAGEPALTETISMPDETAIAPAPVHDQGLCGYALVQRLCTLFRPKADVQGPAAASVTARLEVWTPERGGGPDERFERVGTTPATTPDPRDPGNPDARVPQTLNTDPLPPQANWGQPVWNMAALERYHDAATNPEGTCSSEFQQDQNERAICVKVLRGDGYPAPDFFWEFLRGFWVNGVPSDNLVLGGGRGRRTILSERGSSVLAGEAEINTDDGRTRYHYVRVPMAYFRPFGPLNAHPQKQYGDTGWPFQFYCPGVSCGANDWKEASDADVSNGYNSVLLRLRAENDKGDRAVLRLNYPGQALARGANPCSGDAGLERPAAEATKEAMWMYYRGANRRFAWLAKLPSDRFGEDQYRPGAFGIPGFESPPSRKWSKDDVDRAKRAAKTTRLELKEMRPNGERAIVCVTFAFDSQVAGGEQHFSGSRLHVPEWRGAQDPSYERHVARRADRSSASAWERWATIVGRWRGRLSCSPEYPYNLSLHNRQSGEGSAPKVDGFAAVGGVLKDVGKVVDVPLAVMKLPGVGESKLFSNVFGTLKTVNFLVGIGVELAQYLLASPPKKTAKLETEPYNVARKDQALVDNQIESNGDRDHPRRAISGWYDFDQTDELLTQKVDGYYRGKTYFAPYYEGIGAISDSGRWSDTLLRDSKTVANAAPAQEKALENSLGTGEKPGYQDVALYSQNRGEISAWIECTNRKPGK